MQSSIPDRMSNTNKREPDSRERQELREKLLARINKRAGFERQGQKDPAQTEVDDYSERTTPSAYAKEDIYVQEALHHTEESKQHEITERKEHHEQVYRSLIEMALQVAQQMRSLLYSKMASTDTSEPW